MKEICICAAVLANNGKYYRGHRHSDCIRTIYEREGLSVSKGSRSNQGFITSHNRFVDREEGARLQREAGINSVWTKAPVKELLFSEDLY